MMRRFAVQHHPSVVLLLAQLAKAQVLTNSAAKFGVLPRLQSWAELTPGFPDHAPEPEIIIICRYGTYLVLVDVVVTLSHRWTVFRQASAIYEPVPARRSIGHTDASGEAKLRPQLRRKP